MTHQTVAEKWRKASRQARFVPKSTRPRQSATTLLKHIKKALRSG